MIEIFLLKNVVKYLSYIQHIVEMFLFCYLIYFDMRNLHCTPGFFYSGTCSVQGFDMKLLEKENAQCQISFGFIQSRWNYFCMFFSQVNDYVK